MDFTFTGATSRQQQLFLAAAGSLLNFDLDKIETDVTVSFTTNPTPAVHNEFASTVGTTISIRTDAPDFSGLDPSGQRWGMPFFNEVVAHELCHVLLGLLPAETLDQVADMFDTTTATWDDPEAWVDRPLEGICETFKDAFLPQELRRYANRTNQTIPLHQYPQFRRLFREAEGTGSSFSSFTYGDSSHSSGDPYFIHQLSFEEEVFIYYTGVSGGKGLYVHMEDITGGPAEEWVVSGAAAELWLAGPYMFKLNHLAEPPFYPAPPAGSVRVEYNDGGIGAFEVELIDPPAVGATITPQDEPPSGETRPGESRTGTRLHPRQPSGGKV